MPRYYLHQVHKGEWIPDSEGEEFADVDAVRAEAVIAAREIMAQRIIAGDELDHSRFEIKDRDGQVVLVFPFTQALGKDGA